MVVKRCAAESTGVAIKREPPRQNGAVTQGSRIAQSIKRIHVAEGMRSKLKTECRIFGGVLIGNGVGQGWGIVGIGDGDGESIGDI